MEENTASFEEFFGALDESEGNQTDVSEFAEESEESTHENASEDTHEGEEGSTSQEETESSKDATEEKSTAEGEQTFETFTIKVNKEERQVTKEELIALAQKGADYDRVKQQADKGKTDNQALTEKLGKTQEAYDLLSVIAKDAGVDIPTLLDTFRMRQMMDKENLSEKEAKERLGRLKAEEKLNALQAQNPKKTPDQLRQERAERELKEFRENFPDVDIKTLSVEEMAGDIAKGMTMTQAYLKLENRRQQEEIQKLNSQLKAKEQNAKNRLSSPGSASDSGASKAKDKFDDFFSAFG